MRAAARERIHVRHHRLDDFLRRQMPLARHEFYQPLGAKFFFRGIIRFGDPVSAEHHNVARMQFHMSALVADAREKSHHHSALGEKFHVAIHAHHRRLHVAAGVLFALLWAGTFVTGIFFLPHAFPPSP